MYRSFIRLTRESYGESMLVVRVLGVFSVCAKFGGAYH